MRVNAIAAPPEVHVERITTREPIRCEVRVTENVELIGEGAYVYDEYIFHVNEEPGLEQKVRDHLEEWILTGRGLEVKPEASTVYHMEQGYLHELGDLVEMIYDNDLEVIG